MGAVRATFDRTVTRTRSVFSSAFAIGCFLSVSGLLFARALEAGEGGQLSLTVILATSVAPVLPALAALLGMDVWSDERLTRRMDALLSIAVPEQAYVLGKFLGVLAWVLMTVVLHFILCLGTVRFLSPSALADVTPVSVVLALLAVGLQGMLWTAVAVTASALFRHAASAACATLVVLVGLPRGIWLGLMSWSEAGRTAFGEMPLDVHVSDISSGLLSVGSIALYPVLTLLALLVTARLVSLCRLVGRGARLLRLTTCLTVFLALVFAGMTALTLSRVNATIDIARLQSGGELSVRTRNILAETSGMVTITAFLPRKDPLFRPVSRLMRELQRKSEALGGARIELRFVDPRWDVAAADRLVRRGVVENSLVFETGRRSTTISIRDGFGERICASALRRIAAPLRRQKVYWTVGHGESRFDDYGAFGMSDIARDLFREGFEHATVDLASVQSVPSDCALVLVAGARDDFSRAELGRLNAYLQEGGRLLVLLASSKTGGVVSLLPSWGVKPYDRLFPKTSTLSGTDVIVTDFAEHPVTAALKGSRIVLDRPVAFAPSSAVGSGTGVDSIGYRPVARVDACDVVAASERGGGAGTDLAIRPTRLVVLGDATFALNGQIAVRASGNRDFFLNCIAYLSGTEAHGSGEDEVGSFSSGMDRLARRHLVLALAVGFPSVVFALMFLGAVRRRNRS